MSDAPTPTPAPEPDPSTFDLLRQLAGKVNATTILLAALLGLGVWREYRQAVPAPPPAPSAPSAVATAASAYIKAQAEVCTQMAAKERAGTLSATDRAEAAKALRLPAAKAFADSIEAASDKPAAWDAAAAAMKGALK